MFPNLKTAKGYTPGSPAAYPPVSSSSNAPCNTPEYYPTPSPSAPPTPTTYPHNNAPGNFSSEPPPFAPPPTSMYPHSPTKEYYPSEPPPPPPVIGIPAGYDNQHTHRASSPLQNQFQPAKVRWTTGLCDCFDDVGNCCTTMFCPCVTFGRIAEIVNKGSSSCAGRAALYTVIMCLTGCACLYSCRYRTKLRRQYSVAGGSCGDCLTHCCCECCALCQEYRELKNRGFDMHTGWEENMEKQGRGVTVPPAMGGGMIR